MVVGSYRNKGNWEIGVPIWFDDWQLLHVNMSLSLIRDNMPIGLRSDYEHVKSYVLLWLNGCCWGFILKCYDHGFSIYSILTKVNHELFDLSSIGSLVRGEKEIIMFIVFSWFKMLNFGCYPFLD